MWKVKVTLEGRMIKWQLIELFRAIISTFMHGYQKKSGIVVLLEKQLCHLKHLFSEVEGQGHT